MKSCPSRSLPVPDGDPMIPLEFLGGGLFRQHQDGEAIYVHTELLDPFASSYLPRLRGRFVLLTGDSTKGPMSDVVRPETVLRICEQDNLLTWFAQNYDGEGHQKIQHLPIGLDYHTLSIGRQLSWGQAADPVAQEQALDAVRRQLPALKDRRELAHCNAHFTISHPVRATLRDELPSNAVAFQPEWLTRAESWQVNGQCGATLSPRGYGIDCHRTWEAIVLGALPIVDAEPIANLLGPLPHLYVQDWTRLTAEQVADAIGRAQEETYDFAPLLLAYWQDKFAGLPTRSLPMRYQDFMETPLQELKTIYNATG